MSQQNLWSYHRVLTASYRVEHSSSMESRSSSAGSSAFIESSTQNWSSRLSTTDDRSGLETFCLETTKIHSTILYNVWFSSSFFKKNELLVCLYVLFYFNEHYQTSMMRSRVTHFEWWIWETKDNPETESIKHLLVQGFACDQSQCHMFLLYSMVPFIFIYIA